MKNTEHLIEAIVNILQTLSPGALRRVLIAAKREQERGAYWAR